MVAVPLVQCLHQLQPAKAENTSRETIHEGGGTRATMMTGKMRRCLLPLTLLLAVSGTGRGNTTVTTTETATTTSVTTVTTGTMSSVESTTGTMSTEGRVQQDYSLTFVSRGISNSCRL